MLQQLLTGNELAGSGSETMGQEEGTAAIAAARDKYALKLVDVNSTNKGSPAGGVQSFSAMVVVGDGEVCHVLRMSDLHASLSFTRPMSVPQGYRCCC